MAVKSRQPYPQAYPKAKIQKHEEIIVCWAKNEARKVEEIPPEELNGFISEFIVAVRKKDGEYFEPSSLRVQVEICSFNRHLKSCKYRCNIIEDKEFEQVQQAVEAQSKELKKHGRGNKQKTQQKL